MRFEDIFKSEGLYRSDSFRDGVAFKISPNIIGGNLELSLVTYKNVDDFIPTEELVVVYDNLFKKEYTKVLNRGQLFNQ
jgi:hypothetical protein